MTSELEFIFYAYSQPSCRVGIEGRLVICFFPFTSALMLLEHLGHISTNQEDRATNIFTLVATSFYNTDTMTLLKPFMYATVK